MLVSSTVKKRGDGVQSGEEKTLAGDPGLERACLRSMGVERSPV